MVQYIFYIDTSWLGRWRWKKECYNCGRVLKVGVRVVTRKTSKGKLKVHCYTCARMLNII